MHTHGDLYRAATVGYQVAGTVTQYPTKLHYPDIELSQSVYYPNIMGVMKIGNIALRFWPSVLTNTPPSNSYRLHHGPVC